MDSATALVDGVNIGMKLMQCKKDIVSLQSRTPVVELKEADLSDLDNFIFHFACVLSGQDDEVLNEILEIIGFDGIRGDEADYGM